MKLYVKKLWSTHPDLFLYLELNDAEKQYNGWTKNNTTFDESFDKTFVDWLETEIDTQPREGSKCKCCGGRFK